MSDRGDGDVVGEQLYRVVQPQASTPLRIDQGEFGAEQAGQGAFARADPAGEVGQTRV